VSSNELEEANKMHEDRSRTLRVKSSSVFQDTGDSSSDCPIDAPPRASNNACPSNSLNTAYIPAFNYFFLPNTTDNSYDDWDLHLG